MPFFPITFIHLPLQIAFKILSLIFHSSKNPKTQEIKMSVEKIAEIKKSNPENIMAACFDETYFKVFLRGYLEEKCSFFVI